jgi:hypothetical protein
VNAKDADINPVMTLPPRLCDQWTEITFSLIQFEIATTACLVGATFPLQSKEAIINSCEERISATYLRYCDGTEPIHWLARHIAHVLLLELRLKIHGRQDLLCASYLSDPSHPRQDQLFLAAVDVLDSRRTIETEPEAARWSWLLAGYKKFRPLSFVLAELCHRQRSAAVDRAWEVATTAYYGLWEKDGMDTAHGETLRQLMYRAQLARNTAISAERTLWQDQGFQDVTVSESSDVDYLSLSTVLGQWRWNGNFTNRLR